MNQFSESPFLPLEMLNKILYEFKGMQTPTATIMQDYFKLEDINPDDDMRYLMNSFLNEMESFELGYTDAYGNPIDWDNVDEYGYPNSPYADIELLDEDYDNMY